MTAEEQATADAAAKAASDQAAADQQAVDDKAAADAKAASDKVAADAAAAAAHAGKTPEQLAAEQAAADAETARKAAELQAKPPEKYALTLPDNAPFDESILEPLSAEATALGLSQAQFDTLVKHRASVATAVSQQFLAELEADRELGGANLPHTKKHAVAGLEYVFPRGTPGNDLIRKFLDASGFGNHPEVIREFVRIGKARAEDRPYLGTHTESVERKPFEDVMYPTMASS